jgi:hypothetical protein
MTVRDLTSDEQRRTAGRWWIVRYSGLDCSPRSASEIDPSFQHFDAADLPVVEGDGLWARVIAGSAFGQQSPRRRWRANVSPGRTHSRTHVTLDSRPRSIRGLRRPPSEHH